MSRSEKAKLRELIERIERETSGEISVVLLHDAHEPRKFALDHFNHLGIGKKELDNGVLILVVLGTRRIELVVGHGLQERIPQTFFQRLIDEALAPHFRDGKIGEGLYHAVEALGHVLAEVRPHTPPHSQHSPGVVDLDLDTHR